MASVNPYLNFNGNCEEALRFYQSVFGGEFTTMQRFRDFPSENPVAGDEGEKIMHICLPLGSGSMIMACDVPHYFPQAVEGTNFNISVEAESEDDALRIFNGLTSGGQITMPIERAFWGALFGMLQDKYGIRWMISFTYK